MALEGTIKDFGLPDIFQLIGLQRKTGILTLEGGRETITVLFENGMVVGADSSAKRIEDRLGYVLVKQGKLAKERLDEVLLIQKQTLQRLGHVLASYDYITRKDLKDALTVQVSQLVFRVFRWREGHYQFEPAETVDWDRDNFVPMSADFILMEGIRMVDEWPIIEKKIPSMEVVFKAVVDASNVEILAAGDQEFGADPRRPESNRIRLAPEEERILRKVDGQRTVQSIIDTTGAPEFEVCRTLFDLLNRNLIAPAGRGEFDNLLADHIDTGPASRMPGYFLLGVALFLATTGIVARRNAPFSVPLRPSLLADVTDGVRDGVGLFQLRNADRAVAAFIASRGALPDGWRDLESTGLVGGEVFAEKGGRLAFERRGGSVRLTLRRQTGPSLALDRSLGEAP